MNLYAWVALNKGKIVNFPGGPYGQCVDLVKVYNRDVVGGNEWKANAADYVKVYDADNYNYVKNTPLYIPPPGAIAIWNNKVGEGFGHVGIVVSAGLMSFVSFDQNWPKGSPAIEVKHAYTNVVGFLVPKSKDLIAKYNGLRSELVEIMKKYPPA